MIKQWSTGGISGNTIADNDSLDVVIDRSPPGVVYDNTIEGSSSNRTATGAFNDGSGIPCPTGLSAQHPSHKNAPILALAHPY